MKDIEQANDKPMVDRPSREERIREIAYQRFLARGQDGSGDALADWQAAEAEIDLQDASTEGKRKGKGRGKGEANKTAGS